MKEKRYPSEKADRFMLRLPEGLRECIKDRAGANERSMNSEIIYLIRKGIEKPNDQTGAA